MKTVIRYGFTTLACVAAAVPVAFSASSAGDRGGSLLLTLFIGFFALIVVFQLVPACLLFVGMLRGLFFRGHNSREKRSQV